MKNLQTLAIITNSVHDYLPQILDIKSFMTEYYDIKDSFVCTDSLDCIYDGAILPMFYLKFYEGYVAFLEFDHYLSYKNLLNNVKCIVYVKPNLPLENQVDRSLIKDCDLFTYSNNKPLIIQSHAI